MDNHNSPEFESIHNDKRPMSRRGLLKRAGWAAPVVIAVAVPIDAYAQASCCHSQGFYKNRDAWPVAKLQIGGVTYDKDQLLAILKEPPKGGNATTQLLHQLIAAKLNIAAGIPAPTKISDIIGQADRALASYRILPLPPKAPDKGSEDKRKFRKWAEALEKFNTEYCWVP